MLIRTENMSYINGFTSVCYNFTVAYTYSIDRFHVIAPWVRNTTVHMFGCGTGHRILQNRFVLSNTETFMYSIT